MLNTGHGSWDLAMTNIIISHRKECKKHWRPFNKKGIVEEIREIWEHHVKGSMPYKNLKTKFDENDLSPKCYYLRNEERAEKALHLFGAYQGCIFDLDAYYEGIGYLVTEVESLPRTVFGGGISELKKDYTSNPGLKALLFHKPINDKNELVPYLECILIFIREATDPNFAEALNKRVVKEYETLKRYSRGGDGYAG